MQKPSLHWNHALSTYSSQLEDFGGMAIHLHGTNCWPDTLVMLVAESSTTTVHFTEPQNLSLLNYYGSLGK